MKNDQSIEIFINQKHLIRMEEGNVPLKIVRQLEILKLMLEYSSLFIHCFEKGRDIRVTKVMSNIHKVPIYSGIKF